MISLAEYQAYANDLLILGQNTDQQIGESLDQSGSKQDAIKKAKTFIPPYQKALKAVMDQSMYDIATNTLDHYRSQIKIDLPDQIVRDVVREQYIKKYYGATLNQRLVLTRLRLNRVITQTAQTGIGNLSGLFSNPIPFGAQTSVSKKLLQGTAIKIEQDIARKVAQKADIRLVRWTLAKDHMHPCHCEAYASKINKKVKSYIEDKKLEIDSAGVFFIEDLPDPPHPNCQCEFNLIGDSGEAVPSRGKRPFARLRRLVHKILRS